MQANLFESALDRAELLSHASWNGRCPKTWSEPSLIEPSDELHLVSFDVAQ